MTEPMTDAKRALKAAEAARDAALARALPEPVLMETVEQVEALAPGAYRIRARWKPGEWLLGHRYPTRTWIPADRHGRVRRDG